LRSVRCKFGLHCHLHTRLSFSEDKITLCKLEHLNISYCLGLVDPLTCTVILQNLNLKSLHMAEHNLTISDLQGVSYSSCISRLRYYILTSLSSLQTLNIQCNHNANIVEVLFALSHRKLSSLDVSCYCAYYHLVLFENSATRDIASAVSIIINT
jgi:hypothetical protein